MIASLVRGICFRGLVLATVVFALFKWLFPAFYSPWFPLMWLGFTALEVGFLLMLVRIKQKVSDIRLVHVYMAIMVVKMFVAVAIIALYSYCGGDNVRAFALNFMTLYLGFLGLEAHAFIQFERLMKEKK